MQVQEPQSDYGFTYADYVSWRFKERIELITGRIFKMSPAPSIIHQRISLNIEKTLIEYLEKGKCTLFHAPVDVKLKGKSFRKKTLPDDKVFTVVQPDIAVVCDEAKLNDPRCIDDAPEMIIEILSPGNTLVETKYKRELYEENGVLEYWVVYPEYRQVQVYLQKDIEGYSKPDIYEVDDIISSKVLKGYRIKTNDIFNLK